MSWLSVCALGTRSHAAHVPRRAFTTAKKSHAPLEPSPAVRYLLAKHKLNLKNIPPTGPKGRVLKGDVLRFLAAPPKPTPTSGSKPGSAYSDVVATDSQRQRAQESMVSKSTIPHAFASTQIDLQQVLRLANLHQLQPIHFAVRAAALALRDVPEANVRWDNSIGDVVSLQHNHVAAEINPAGDRVIIWHADGKGLEAIASEFQVVLTTVEVTVPRPPIIHPTGSINRL